MNKLLSRAFASAAGVAVYISFFAWVVSHGEQWFGNNKGILTPILLLTLFVVSASITGSLVLLRPVMMFMEGKKEEALRLFAYTVGFLAGFAVIIALILAR